MGLNTENASAVVGGGNANAGQTHKVEMLIGTYVKSVGKDVKAGAVVEISNDDYRFLKPYGYCKDFSDEVETDEGADSTTDDAGSGDEGTGTTEGDESKDEAPKGNKVEGKRK